DGEQERVQHLEHALCHVSGMDERRHLQGDVVEGDDRKQGERDGDEQVNAHGYARQGGYDRIDTIFKGDHAASVEGEYPYEMIPRGALNIPIRLTDRMELKSLYPLSANYMMRPEVRYLYYSCIVIMLDGSTRGAYSSVR